MFRLFLRDIAAVDKCYKCGVFVSEAFYKPQSALFKIGLGKGNLAVCKSQQLSLFDLLSVKVGIACVS